MVEADSGAIGGKDSHEFIALAEVGEDTVVLCGSCGYAANVERAAFKEDAQPTGGPTPPGGGRHPRYQDHRGSRPLPRHTGMEDPQGRHIHGRRRDGLRCHQGRPRGQRGQAEERPRGAELRFATPQEVEEAGLVPGSASPIGANARIVADDSLRLGSNFIMGSNKDGYHLRNANSPRDFEPDLVTDIALVQDGYACPTCDGVLSPAGASRWATSSSWTPGTARPSDAPYPGQDDVQRPVVMGCYGIGVGRLLAATVEQTHDKAGMVLNGGRRAVRGQARRPQRRARGRRRGCRRLITITSPRLASRCSTTTAKSRWASSSTTPSCSDCPSCS